LTITPYLSLIIKLLNSFSKNIITFIDKTLKARVLDWQIMEGRLKDLMIVSKALFPNKLFIL